MLKVAEIFKFIDYWWLLYSRENQCGYEKFTMNLDHPRSFPRQVMGCHGCSIDLARICSVPHSGPHCAVPAPCWTGAICAGLLGEIGRWHSHLENVGSNGTKMKIWGYPIFSIHVPFRIPCLMDLNGPTSFNSPASGPPGGSQSWGPKQRRPCGAPQGVAKVTLKFDRKLYNVQSIYVYIYIYHLCIIYIYISLHTILHTIFIIDI